MQLLQEGENMLGVSLTLPAVEVGRRFQRNSQLYQDVTLTNSVGWSSLAGPPFVRP